MSMRSIMRSRWHAYPALLASGVPRTLNCRCRLRFKIFAGDGGRGGRGEMQGWMNAIRELHVQEASKC